MDDEMRSGLQAIAADPFATVDVPGTVPHGVAQRLARAGLVRLWGRAGEGRAQLTRQGARTMGVRRG
jgi:hypothetical protein